MSHRTFYECSGISREFGKGSAAHAVLRDITLSFARGECCALLGPSGSGKTTLLSILGCLLAPTRGEVVLDGCSVDFSGQSQLCQLRRRRIGFVFQHARLLPFLTLRENLEVFGHNAGVPKSKLKVRIKSLLTELGIAEHGDRWPDDLSGGERQRAAVVRALLHDPVILLADEPTGALNATSGRNVMQLLVDQARQRNAVLVTVTHDERVIDLFDRVVRIDSGKVVV